jgi:hypothetical protein
LAYEITAEGLGSSGPGQQKRDYRHGNKRAIVDDGAELDNAYNTVRSQDGVRRPQGTLKNHPAAAYQPDEQYC